VTGLEIPLWIQGTVGLGATITLWWAYRLGRWRGYRLRAAAGAEGDRRRLSGRLSELWAPYEAGFPGSPDDAYFLGAPIDFVVFEGLSEGALEEIVFVEVKSGAGKLTKRERAIRNAVSAGKVSWLELRLPGADER
jgi:predicted Holliday junction resolvase-like endonuclease